MKKRTFALLLLPAAVGLLAGCSLQGELHYSPGYWRDNLYSSAFLGLQFTLPDGWETASPEELAEMEAAANRALDLQLDKDGALPAPVCHYELSASDPESGEGILILVQETSTRADDYLSGLQTGAELEGAAYTAGDVLHLEVAGRRYLALSLTVQGELALYQRQYARREGDYLFLIMLFTPDEEELPFSTLESYLSPLSEN